MKKSKYVALVMSVCGVLLLGIGLSMTTLTQWQLFSQGVIVGCVGLLILLCTIIVYRKLEHKPALQINSKTLRNGVILIIGIMAFGIGMCLTMVYNQYLTGIAIGFVGIVILLGLIPLHKGLIK